MMKKKKCGHLSMGGDGILRTCDRENGHKGHHGRTVQLRDGKSTTNWGDDGLAIHATKYPENGTAPR